MPNSLTTLQREFGSIRTLVVIHLGSELKLEVVYQRVSSLTRAPFMPQNGNTVKDKAAIMRGVQELYFSVSVSGAIAMLTQSLVFFLPFHYTRAL